MSQNKRKGHAVYYFDPRVLENYCCNDILFTFELAGRQVDLYNIKRSVKDDNN